MIEKKIGTRDMLDGRPWAARDPNGRVNEASMLDIQDWFYNEGLVKQKFPIGRLIDFELCRRGGERIGPVRADQQKQPASWLPLKRRSSSMGIAPYSPARRVVTGHDSTGKAIVLIDDNTPYTARRDEKTLQQRIWVTDKFPVAMDGDKDRAAIEVRIAPPANGTIIRYLDIPPESEEAEEAAERSYGEDARATSITCRRACGRRAIPACIAPAPSTTRSCSRARSTCSLTTPRCI